MKKISIFLVILTLTYLSFVGLRNKMENTHDVDLHLPTGIQDRSLISAYTKECTETTLPKSEFPKGIMGISTVPPFSERYYTLSTELGATWMRAEFDWRAIERADGTYDWAAADRMVSEMNKNNFHILGTIAYIPTHLHTWEEIREHFQKFTHELGERYHSQGVSYYEIFNEPNLPGWGWLDKRTSPENYVGEYTILLAIANKEIHDINSHAVIVLGGISSDAINGMPYTDFTKKLLSFESSKCFDIFAFHPYGHEGKFKQTAKELTLLLEQSTTTPKSIWFNEYGTPENKKLTYTIDSMFKERDAADAWFWFTLRDLRPNNRWNYGLTDYNFEKKDSFIFFQNNMSTRKISATNTPSVSAQ